MRRLDEHAIVCAEPRREPNSSDSERHAESKNLVPRQYAVFGTLVETIVDLKFVTRSQAARQAQPALDECISGGIIQRAGTKWIRDSLKLPNASGGTADADGIVAVTRIHI